MDLNQLQTQFQEHMVLNSQAVRDFPWANQDAYALYLKQTWGFVRHSCSLLGGCATRLNDFPVIQKRFFDHVKEEYGHELLAKRDIEHLGYDFEALPVLSITKGLVHAQYYHVHHVSPFALFGYIMLLESLPVQCADMLPMLLETHGEKACSFLKLHVEEDEGHVQSAWDTVSQLPEAGLEHMFDNFVESSDNFRAMLAEVSRLGLAMSQARSATA